MELTVIDIPAVRRHAPRPLSVSPHVLTVATVCALPTGALPTSASAQAAKPVINGRITDQAGRALEGAIITSSANASAVQTNKDGAFTLPAPNSRLVRRVRLRGFKWDSLVVDAAIRYRQDQNQVLANITPTVENTGTRTGGNITSNVQ